MRRLFRIVIGFIAAMLAAGATQVMFALPPTELLTLDEAARSSRVIEMGGLMLRAATHSAIFCVGFAPIAILIGELQRRRAWTYYAIVGIIISLGGFLAEFAAQNAAQPTILNTYALIAFVTTGLVSGLIYWNVSGRNAGRRRAAARIRVAGGPDAGTWETDEEYDDGRGKGTGAGTGGSQSDGDGDKRSIDPSSAKPGQDDEFTPTQPMTSVPAAGPKAQERPRLVVAGSVPNSGDSKRQKG